MIRNNTIKAALLIPYNLKKSDQEDPIYNDLDHYSRPYDCPIPLPNSHFVRDDSLLPLKALSYFDSTKERDELLAKLKDHEHDPRLMNLMRMIYNKADLNSLGYSSTNSSNNRVPAFEKLKRLKPLCLRFIVPVTKPLESQVPGVGSESESDGLAILLDALHLNIGSGENYRHLEHGSEACLGSNVLRIMRSLKQPATKI